MEGSLISKLLPYEFAVGLAMTLALYLLDKCGKSGATINALFLILITGLLVHPALSIPWVSSCPELAFKIWRGVAVSAGIILAVSWFGIWTWPDMPKDPALPKRPNVVIGDVTSYGQQGGITAGQVNINEPPRIVASPQLQEKTGDSTAPWITKFRIRATGPVMTGDLKLKCSGPVMRAGISRINPHSFSSGSNGPDPSDPTVVVYQLSPEPLAADIWIQVAAYSANPVTVLSGTIGNIQIDFNGGK